MRRRMIQDFDQESYEDMIHVLQEHQCSIGDLAERYDKSSRTIYRWLQYAEADGWDVIKRGVNPVLYQLAVPVCQTS